VNGVKCPRCLQVWYSDDDPEGGERLCSGCLSDLRAAGDRAHRAYGLRSLRKSHRSIALNYFLIYVLALAGLDVFVIGLTLLFPAIFGPVCLTIGLVLFVLGSVGFRWLTWGWWWPYSFSEIDWDLVKWPAVAAAAGLVCLVASGRMLL
jgi:hypothetical protein